MSTDNDRATEALRRLAQPAGRSVALAFTAAISGTYRFWADRGAIAVAAPSVIDSISSPAGLGSDSIPVQVVIGSRQSYLTDSAQFTLELATRVLGRTTFYVMPSFRGEHSDQTHLAEFVHAEVELLGSLNDVLRAAEEYVRSLIVAIGDALSDADDVILTRYMHSANAATGAWPRIDYAEVVDLLKGDDSLVKRVGDWWMPTRAGELRIVDMSGGAPVWLVGYPSQCVPFYQAHSEDPAFAQSADLLVPRVGEILGAGERHDSSAELRRSIRSHSVGETNYRWYIQLRDSHPARTSGFGVGIERLIAWLLCLQDIAEVPVFPRRNQ